MGLYRFRIAAVQEILPAKLNKTRAKTRWRSV
jgi:hypothetical protein